MLYSTIVGSDALALPIIFLTVRFYHIHNLEKIKRIKNISPKQRKIILSNSEYEHYYAVMYPDEFNYHNKNIKLRNKFNSSTIYGLCKTGEREVTKFKHHPSLQQLKTVSVNKCAELRVASLIADSIRTKLSQPAAACKPEFSFAKHSGYATNTHYLEIFKHGLSRFHHSLNPLMFINFFFRKIDKEDTYPLLKECIHKEPWWWKYNYEDSFYSYFTEDDDDYLSRLEEYFNTPRLKDLDVERLLKPLRLSNHHKKEFVNWLENNEPEGWLNGQDPSDRKERIRYSEKRIRGGSDIRAGSI